MIDLNELEQVAKAATKGKWVRGVWKSPDMPVVETSDRVDQEQWTRKVEEWRKLPKILAIDEECLGSNSTMDDEFVISGCGCCGSPHAEPQDATHIAAADPSTVIALIARIRELEAGLAESCELIGELTEDTPERAHARRLSELRGLIEKGVTR